MKVWIVCINYDDGCCSDAYEIDDVYSSEQKAKEAVEELHYENPELDFTVEILEKVVK